MVAIRLGCNPTEGTGWPGWDGAGRQRPVVEMAKVLAGAVELEKDRREDVILER